MSTATPDLINDDEGTFTLVSNHFVGTTSGLEMSIAFNKARLAFIRAHLPKSLTRCILFYDIRGQAVSNARLDEIRNAFPACDVQILS